MSKGLVLVIWKFGTCWLSVAKLSEFEGMFSTNGKLFAVVAGCDSSH